MLQNLKIYIKLFKSLRKFVQDGKKKNLNFLIVDPEHTWSTKLDIEMIEITTENTLVSEKTIEVFQLINKTVPATGEVF